MKLFLLAIAFAAAAFGWQPPARAGTVSIDDSFDGPKLDSAWTVSLEADGWIGAGAASWSYGFNSGALEVTDISPLSGTEGLWSSVSLRRSLSSAGDFAFALDVGWSSEAGNSDLKKLYFSMYDEHGAPLVRIIYQDAWVAHSGRWGGYENIGKTLTMDEMDSLEHTGREVLTLSRTGGDLTLSVGDREILTAFSTEPAFAVGIEFLAAENTLGATFDKWIAYDFQGEYSVVPLPTAGLAGLFTLGLIGLVRRATRRNSK